MIDGRLIGLSVPVRCETGWKLPQSGSAGYEVRSKRSNHIFHLFLINHAGKPDIPVNCTVQNITSESFQIDCSEGFDGGLPQVFHVEVVDAGSPRLLYNLTSPIPMFVLTGLKPGQNLILYVYSSNRKGISEKVRLEEQTIQEAEKRTGKRTISKKRISGSRRERVE